MLALNIEQAGSYLFSSKMETVPSQLQQYRANTKTICEATHA